MAKIKFLYWKKICTIIVSLTFILPHISWAFDASGYSGTSSSPLKIEYSNKTISIPPKLGMITGGFQGQDKMVVLIKDLHCHYEVQKNIAATIDHLVEKYDVKLVGEEGAFDTVKLDVLRDFPLENIREAVTDYYVRQGRITGAEYYAAIAKNPVDLEGIENPELYNDSYAMIQSFLNAESQGYCCDLRDSLDVIKPRLYNKDLLEFDSKTQAYRKGDMVLLNYVLYLKKIAQQLSVDTTNYPNINHFVDDKQDHFSGTKSGKLYQEIDHLDKAIRKQLYTSQEQKQLDSLSARLDIIEKLLNISVTQEELARFRKEREQFKTKTFLDFVQRVETHYSASSQNSLDVNTLDQYLDQVYHFYQLADKRSEAFVDIILNKMERRNENIAIMINGGFHTEKVRAYLEQKNISYVSIDPTVTRQDMINPYFSILQGRQLPIEQLLEQNQTIFAAPIWPEQPHFIRNMLAQLLPILKARLAKPGANAKESPISGYFEDYAKANHMQVNVVDVTKEPWQYGIANSTISNVSFEVDGEDGTIKKRNIFFAVVDNKKLPYKVREAIRSQVGFCRQYANTVVIATADKNNFRLAGKLIDEMEQSNFWNRIKELYFLVTGFLKDTFSKQYLQPALGAFGGIALMMSGSKDEYPEKSEIQQPLRGLTSRKPNQGFENMMKRQPQEADKKTWSDNEIARWLDEFESDPAKISWTEIMDADLETRIKLAYQAMEINLSAAIDHYHKFGINSLKFDRPTDEIEHDQDGNLTGINGYLMSLIRENPDNKMLKALSEHIKKYEGLYKGIRVLTQKKNINVDNPQNPYIVAFQYYLEEHLEISADDWKKIGRKSKNQDIIQPILFFVYHKLVEEVEKLEEQATAYVQTEEMNENLANMYWSIKKLVAFNNRYHLFGLKVSPHVIDFRTLFKLISFKVRDRWPYEFGAGGNIEINYEPHEQATPLLYGEYAYLSELVLSTLVENSIKRARTQDDEEQNFQGAITITFHGEGIITIDDNCGDRIAKGLEHGGAGTRSGIARASRLVGMMGGTLTSEKHEPGSRVKIALERYNNGKTREQIQILETLDWTTEKALEFICKADEVPGARYAAVGKDQKATDNKPELSKDDEKLTAPIFQAAQKLKQANLPIDVESLSKYTSHTKSEESSRALAILEEHFGEKVSGPQLLERYERIRKEPWDAVVVKGIPLDEIVVTQDVNRTIKWDDDKEKVYASIIAALVKLKTAELPIDSENLRTYNKTNKSSDGIRGNQILSEHFYMYVGGPRILKWFKTEFDEKRKAWDDRVLKDVEQKMPVPTIESAEHLSVEEGPEVIKVNPANEFTAPEPEKTKTKVVKVKVAKPRLSEEEWAKIIQSKSKAEQLGLLREAMENDFISVIQHYDQLGLKDYNFIGLAIEMNKYLTSSITAFSMADLIETQEREELIRIKELGTKFYNRYQKTIGQISVIDIKEDEKLLLEKNEIIINELAKSLPDEDMHDEFIKKYATDLEKKRILEVMYMYNLLVLADHMQKIVETIETISEEIPGTIFRNKHLKTISNEVVKVSGVFQPHSLTKDKSTAPTIRLHLLVALMLDKAEQWNERFNDIKVTIDIKPGISEENQLKKGDYANLFSMVLSTLVEIACERYEEKKMPGSIIVRFNEDGSISVLDNAGALSYKQLKNIGKYKSEQENKDTEEKSIVRLERLKQRVENVFGGEVAIKNHSGKLEGNISERGLMVTLQLPQGLSDRVDSFMDWIIEKKYSEVVGMAKRKMKSKVPKVSGTKTDGGPSSPPTGTVPALEAWIVAKTGIFEPLYQVFAAPMLERAPLLGLLGAASVFSSLFFNGAAVPLPVIYFIFFVYGMPNKFGIFASWHDWRGASTISDKLFEGRKSAAIKLSWGNMAALIVAMGLVHFGVMVPLLAVPMLLAFWVVSQFVFNLAAQFDKSDAKQDASLETLEKVLNITQPGTEALGKTPLGKILHTMIYGSGTEAATWWQKVLGVNKPFIGEPFDWRDNILVREGRGFKVESYADGKLVLTLPEWFKRRLAEKRTFNKLETFQTTMALLFAFRGFERRIKNQKGLERQELMDAYEVSESQWTIASKVKEVLQVLAGKYKLIDTATAYGRLGDNRKVNLVGPEISGIINQLLPKEFSNIIGTHLDVAKSVLTKGYAGLGIERLAEEIRTMSEDKIQEISNKQVRLMIIGFQQMLNEARHDQLLYKLVVEQMKTVFMPKTGTLSLKLKTVTDNELAKLRANKQLDSITLLLKPDSVARQQLQALVGSMEELALSQNHREVLGFLQTVLKSQDLTEKESMQLMDLMAQVANQQQNEVALGQDAYNYQVTASMLGVKEVGYKNGLVYMPHYAHVLRHEKSQAAMVIKAERVLPEYAVMNKQLEAEFQKEVLPLLQHIGLYQPGLNYQTGIQGGVVKAFVEYKMAKNKKEKDMALQAMARAFLAMNTMAVRQEKDQAELRTAFIAESKFNQSWLGQNELVALGKVGDIELYTSKLLRTGGRLLKISLREKVFGQEFEMNPAIRDAVLLRQSSGFFFGGAA